MQDWLQAQMANGFAAFTGAVVTGSIPVKDTLLNEWLAAWLADARRGEAATAAPPASTAPVDLRAVLPFVRSATVQAGPGVLTLRVELAVGDRS